MIREIQPFAHWRVAWIRFDVMQGLRLRDAVFVAPLRRWLNEVEVEHSMRLMALITKYVLALICKHNSSKTLWKVGCHDTRWQNNLTAYRWRHRRSIPR